MSKRHPSGDLRRCESCQTPRGSKRRGWATHVVEGQAVAMTCPACPEHTEAVRRVVTKTGGVSFRAVVDGTPPGATTRRQVTRTFPTLGEARLFVQTTRAALRELGVYRGPDRETVTELCDRWLLSRRDSRQVTLEHYSHALLPVRRLVGDRPVTGLTVRDVEALTRELADHGGRDGRPLGPRSVKASLVAFQQAVDLAVYDGTLTRNPVRLVRSPRAERRDQRQATGRGKEHWTPGELLAFKARSDEDDWAGAWRLTLCGLTRADVLGLRWDDVDFSRGAVTVRQGRVAVDGGSVVDDPKSKQRHRTVPVETMHPGTVALLRSLRARQAGERLRAGAAYTDSGFLVVDALGTPVRPEAYSNRFQALAVEAGVPRIRLHSVRHSIAFLCVHELGVPPADAAALLGHSLPVFLSVYCPEAGETGIRSASEAIGAGLAAAGRW